MKAEIVHADQIRVGDRMLCFGAIRPVLSINYDDPECVFIAFDGFHDGVEHDFPKDAPFARILPEPVEEREAKVLRRAVKILASQSSGRHYSLDPSEVEDGAICQARRELESEAGDN
jgi:hypothetical protein